MLEVRVLERAGTPVMALEGELDLATAEQVERALAELEGRDATVLVADLRKLTFIDSTGLRLFVRAHRQVEGSGRRLVLVRGPANVQRVFEVTRLDERLEFVDHPSEAQEAGSPPASPA